MSNPSELKEVTSTKTLNLLLLTIVSLGVYMIVWLYKNTPEIEKIVNAKIYSSVYLIWVSVVFGWALFSSGAAEYDSDIEALYILTNLACFVLYVVWAFKAKEVLQEYAISVHKVDLRMNAFYTVIFNVYYINYCINDLPEEKRKQNLLGGA